ncbi:hypothetical protein FACS1894122_03390 [Alphaproteobacteria bacterium]|nr:hypothetical protein FACS1894122_03390 [Alphaproteobacteria bacterium]
MKKLICSACVMILMSHSHVFDVQASQFAGKKTVRQLIAEKEAVVSGPSSGSVSSSTTTSENVPPPPLLSGDGPPPLPGIFIVSRSIAGKKKIQEHTFFEN